MIKLYVQGMWQSPTGQETSGQMVRQVVNKPTPEYLTHFIGNTESKHTWNVSNSVSLPISCKYSKVSQEAGLTMHSLCNNFTVFLSFFLQISLKMCLSCPVRLFLSNVSTFPDPSI